MTQKPKTVDPIDPELVETDLVGIEPKEADPEPFVWAHNTASGLYAPVPKTFAARHPNIFQLYPNHPVRDGLGNLLPPKPAATT